MPQHDYNIANAPGATVRSDLNSVLAAIVSENSGATAPSITFAYMFWADTLANKLRMRNGANTVWIELGDLDIAFLNLLQRLRETGGPTVLTVGAVADGEFLKRSGTNLIGGGTILDRDVVTADVVNITVETVVYSFSVPGGTLGTNRALRLTLIGDYLSNGGASTNDLVVRVKYGATTVADLAVNNATADATRRGMQLVSTLSAFNATNAQVAFSRLLVNQPNETGGGASDVVMLEVMGMHNAIAIDSTAAQNLVVAFQHTQAHFNISARALAVQVELLR